MSTSFQDAMKNKQQKAMAALPPFIKWTKEGDWLNVIPQSVRTVDGEYGESSVIDCKVIAGATEQNKPEPGEVVSIGLLTELKGLPDYIGKEVLIKYIGEEKRGSGKWAKSMKHFEVYV
jgi:hypothetical protein